MEVQYNKCPVCGKVKVDLLTGKFECSICKSKFIVESDGKIRLLESSVKLNFWNLIYGVLILGITIMIIYFELFKGVKGSPIFTGILLILVNFAIMLRILWTQIRYDKTNKSFTEFKYLFSALGEKRLKYYDIGSRFLMIMFIASPIVGVLLICIGLISKFIT